MCERNYFFATANTYKLEMRSSPVRCLRWGGNWWNQVVWISTWMRPVKKKTANIFMLHTACGCFVYSVGKIILFWRQYGYIHQKEATKQKQIGYFSNITLCWIDCCHTALFGQFLTDSDVVWFTYRILNDFVLCFQARSNYVNVCITYYVVSNCI